MNAARFRLWVMGFLIWWGVALLCWLALYPLWWIDSPPWLQLLLLCVTSWPLAARVERRLLGESKARLRVR